LGGGRGGGRGGALGLGLLVGGLKFGPTGTRKRGKGGLPGGPRHTCRLPGRFPPQGRPEGGKGGIPGGPRAGPDFGGKPEGGGGGAPGGILAGAFRGNEGGLPGGNGGGGVGDWNFRGGPRGETHRRNWRNRNLIFLGGGLLAGAKMLGLRWFSKFFVGIGEAKRNPIGGGGFVSMGGGLSSDRHQRVGSGGELRGGGGKGAGGIRVRGHNGRGGEIPGRPTHTLVIGKQGGGAQHLGGHRATGGGQGKGSGGGGGGRGPRARPPLGWGPVARGGWGTIARGGGRSPPHPY